MSIQWTPSGGLTLDTFTGSTSVAQASFIVPIILVEQISISAHLDGAQASFFQIKSIEVQDKEPTLHINQPPPNGLKLENGNTRDNKGSSVVEKWFTVRTILGSGPISAHPGEQVIFHLEATVPMNVSETYSAVLNVIARPLDIDPYPISATVSIPI